MTTPKAQQGGHRDAPCIDVVVLRGLVAEAESRDGSNTLTEKFFRGGSLSLVGANSPRGSGGRRAGVVIFDEVDGYPASAGTEGDLIELGIRRSEYYWNRKILAGSTPTLAGHSRIADLFEDGDQRRYYVPCLHCGTFQVLKFPNLKWPEGQPERAHFVCEANGCVMEPKDKRGMVEAGEWRADAPEHFTPEHRHASFHIWAAYSYSPNATWGQLATEFVKANRGGALTLQTFVNTVLGETFTVRGDAPAWEPLYRRREPYRIGTVPRGALFSRPGSTCRRDRLVYEVVGWGRGKASWSIDYGMLIGETADLTRGPWPHLDALLARTFPHEAGVGMTIRMLAVDSGYNTQQVYGWARQHPMSRVVAIKGGPSGGALIGAPSPVELTDRGRKLKRGYRVWPVSGHIAKGELYGWLRLEVPTDGTPPPPGFVHFPEYGEEYFRELTAEQLIPVKTARGFVRLEWSLIPGRQNHALDARVYARAAAAVVGLDRFSHSDWAALEAATGQETAVAPSPVAGPPDSLPGPRPRRARPRGSASHAAGSRGGNVAARPLGNANKAAQARRLELLRALWSTDLTLALIAERLGVTESTVSALARQANLPARKGPPRAAPRGPC